MQELRSGEFDVLVGINLIREGLDLPEVSLVAIMDADKEGFLRSETSLIQTIGRAARNINGRVIMYADNITKSLRKALSETNRRRNMQMKYNREHNITPESIKKSMRDILSSIYEADYYTVPKVAEKDEKYISGDELPRMISELEDEMKKYAGKLEFEKAAAVRDKIKTLRSQINKMTEGGFIPLSLADTSISQTERKHKQRRIGHLKAKMYTKKVDSGSPVRRRHQSKSC